ncbi:MAG: glycosyltransferase involved in cell wall biosynthesis [Myxococcota bacterium]|jgi:glycosyltransferase involved in cell wall biosynthesis
MSTVRFGARGSWCPDIVSSGPTLDAIDIIIKTFRRPASLRRLVGSIQRYYPDARVNIADDGDPDAATEAYYEALERDGHTVHRLPFDVGVSAGRNHLVSVTRRPFLLVLDDDFVFSAETRLEMLLAVALARPDAAVIAGRVEDICEDPALRPVDRGPRRFWLDRRRMLHLLPATATESVAGHRCYVADMVANFGLFRRVALQDVAWDPALKLYEHLDFFLGLASHPWRVLLVDQVRVGHVLAVPKAAYREYRHDRAAYYREMAFQKVDLLGVCSHLGDAATRRHVALRSHVEAARRAANAREWKLMLQFGKTALTAVEPTSSGLARLARAALQSRRRFLAAGQFTGRVGSVLKAERNSQPRFSDS